MKIVGKCSCGGNITKDSSYSEIAMEVYVSYACDDCSTEFEFKEGKWVKIKY